MTKKILIVGLLGLVGLIFWSFFSLYLETGREFRSAQELLESGESIDDLQALIGEPTHEWFTIADAPSYLRRLDGFEPRANTVIRVYSKEGLPYWWVHVQLGKEDLEIIWYSITKR